MATGVAGLYGQTVTSRAIKDPRQGRDCVITLNQLTAGETAKAQQSRENPVTLIHVHVRILFTFCKTSKIKNIYIAQRL